MDGRTVIPSYGRTVMWLYGRKVTKTKFSRIDGSVADLGEGPGGPGPPLTLAKSIYSGKN